MIARGEDRHLLISRYLDGELSEEERRRVEEEVRSDAGWAGELAAMKAVSDGLDSVLARVRERGLGAGFEAAVAGEIRRRCAGPARGAAAGRRAGASRLSPRRSLRAFLVPAAAAAAVVLIFGAAVFLAAVGRATRDAGALVVSASPQARAKADGAADGSVPGRLLPGQKLELTVGTVLLAASDGSRFRLRGPSAIEVGAPAGDRPALTLKEGFLLADVAPGKGEFRLGLPGGAAVRVLGTRFDVVAVAGGVGGTDSIAVRVAEGRVAVEGPFGRAVASGGQAVAAKAGTAPAVVGFDAREMIAAWAGGSIPGAGGGGSETAYGGGLEIVAPWPQAGGSPSHSGSTPLVGPADLSSMSVLSVRRETAGTGGEPAVVGIAMDAMGRCYAIERHGDVSILLRLDPSSGAFEEIGRFHGGSQCPPALTPKGLCVCSSSFPAESVVAFGGRDDAGGAGRSDPLRPTWKKDVGASAYAVSVAWNGTVLVSAQNGLHALSEDGAALWSAGGIGEIHAPASVDLEGRVYAAGVDGRVHCLNLSDGGGIWTVRTSDGGRYFQPPVAAGGFVWTVDSAGILSAIGRDGRVSGARAFDGLKLCPVAVRGGVLAAAGSKIFFVPDGAAGPGREVCDIGGRGPVAAWAADGERRLYAATPRGIARLDPNAGGGYEIAAWAPFSENLAPAISLSHGPMALASGRLAILCGGGLLTWPARQAKFPDESGAVSMAGAVLAAAAPGGRGVRFHVGRVAPAEEYPGLPGSRPKKAHSRQHCVMSDRNDSAGKYLE